MAAKLSIRVWANVHNCVLIPTYLTVSSTMTEHLSCAICILSPRPRQARQNAIGRRYTVSRSYYSLFPHPILSSLRTIAAASKRVPLGIEICHGRSLDSAAGRCHVDFTVARADHHTVELSRSPGSSCRFGERHPPDRECFQTFKEVGRNSGFENEIRSSRPAKSTRKSESQHQFLPRVLASGPQLIRESASYAI